MSSGSSSSDFAGIVVVILSTTGLIVTGLSILRNALRDESLVIVRRKRKSKVDWRKIERLEHEIWPNDPKQWTHDRTKCLFRQCLYVPPPSRKVMY